MARLRSFCFTSFLPDKYEAWKQLDVKYVCYGIEVSPETGRIHLQGYCELVRRARISTIKELFDDNGMHIEPRRGTAQQAAIYCKKDGNYHEHGVISQQGARTDISHIRGLLLEENPSMYQVLYEAHSLQAVTIAKVWFTYRERVRDFKPDVSWFWGPTGSGKSYWARIFEETMSAEEGLRTWWSGDNFKWWQGYDAHEIVILDDFRPDQCSFTNLLRVLDRYPYVVENKGGSRSLLARFIIITTPHSPEDSYSTFENLSQLTRRITNVVEFPSEDFPLPINAD